jgi:hypothetical protein
MGVLEALSRPLERARHRADRVAERLGDLLRRPAEHVAQDQHGTLFRRQELDRGDEGELDRLASDQVIEQAIRIRLQVLEIVADQQRLGASACERTQADVGGDRVQPGAELGAGLVAVGSLPSTDHRLLERVVGVVERAEHPVAVEVERLPVWLDQARERLLVHRRPDATRGAGSAGRRRAPSRRPA